jgi:pilus assembly protein CpaF
MSPIRSGIRRRFTQRFNLSDLARVGAVSPAIAEQLAEAVRQRRNVVISGGTGTGKTTLLNALAALIPDHDRIVVIEETAEIHLNKPNLLRLEARRAQNAAR